jgi:argininosuccinate lyase
VRSGQGQGREGALRGTPPSLSHASRGLGRARSSAPQLHVDIPELSRARDASVYCSDMKFAPEYVQHVLNENFEDAKALFLSPLLAIHYAHLVMLVSTGIVSPRDGRRIREALDSISEDQVRRVAYDGTYEDLFFYVERLLIDACGEEVAGRLHTARSRNDIDMTMYRMRQREFVLELLDAALALRQSLVDLAERHRETIIAAHTHTQPAQPTTVAHYLLAVVEQLERDTRRLQAAFVTTNCNPLGACAITGTGFPIDRALTSVLLGFDGPTGNTYGSIATVDYLSRAPTRRQACSWGSGGSCRTCCSGAPSR